MTSDGFLRCVLDERDREQFWASFDQLTPEEYASAVAADGDAVDEVYRREDDDIDSEAVR